MVDRKLIFLGGKGGVGKTTLSCALSLLLSKRNAKTLLISTDPAHSVSDIFRTWKEKGTVRVNENLHYIEIQPERVVKEYVERALRSVEPFFSPEVLSQVREIFRSVEGTPGAEEAAVVDELSKIVLGRGEDYEHFVIDTAPTGHTVSMLRTISRVGSWVEELLKRKLQAQRLREAGGLESREEVLNVLRERRERFLRFSELLLSKRTLFIPVLVPEKLPIEETGRLVGELLKMGVSLELLFVNKVLPQDTTDPFLVRRKEQEREYMREIRRRFSGFKIVEIPMRDRDVRGTEDIEEIAYEIGRRIGL